MSFFRMISAAPKKFLNRHRRYGIRNRLFIFIAVLIGIALVISWRQRQTTINYVVNREKVDLEDESLNSTLNLQLALQTAYAQAVAKIASGPNDSPESHCDKLKLTLQPLDEEFGIRSGICEQVSRTDFSKLEYFDKNRLFENNVDEGSLPMWSEIFWTGQGHAGPDASGDLMAKEDSVEHAHIQLLLPCSNDDSGELQYWLVDFELSDLFKTMTKNVRSLTFIANDKTLKLGPNGSPRAADPRRDVGLEETRSSSPITDAITRFEKENPGRSGLLYCPTRSTFPRSDGVRLADLTSTCPTPIQTLIYSETVDLPPELFQMLSDTALAQIEKRLAGRDPFVRIGSLNQRIGQLRIRSSSPSTLERLKENIRLHARESTDARVNLRWNDIPMDDFVFSLHSIELPGARGKPDNIGYLVRSTALTEIKGSVQRDLNRINKVIGLFIVITLLSTFIVAEYLSGPLARMTEVTRKISRLLKLDDLDEEKLNELLEDLPRQRKDEAGVLAQQFEKTTRQLVLTTRGRLAERTENQKLRDQEAINAEVNEAKDRLLASVGHEMRQPLFPIFANVEDILDSETVGEKEKRRLQTVHKNARELQCLIEDILDYKRILQGNVEPKIEDTDLRELFDELEKHYEYAANERENKLYATVTRGIGSISTDRLRLKRVLHNLISNAIKATHQGQIHISAVPYGIDQIEITVQDEGRGMNQLQKTLVFLAPDERAEIEAKNMDERGPKDNNSTGLGLFISKQLVEAMKGTIEFRSEEGKGTVFKVRLPVEALAGFERRDDPPHRDESSLRLPPAHLEDFPLTSGDRPLAVVVDDDEEAARVLASMLQGMGYKTECVYRSEHAVKVVAERQPDLVTLDVIMPEVNGLEILSQLKNKPETEAIPVIMVSVYPDEGQATLLGANAFVAKPVRRKTFEHTVQQVVHDVTNANVLVVDDDSGCRSEITEILSSFDCRVEVACDGQEALEKLHEMVSLDLAIIDLWMPNINGFDLIEKLRDNPRTSDVPIVALSGRKLGDKERANLEKNVNRFFQKGKVRVASLKNEIRRLLPAANKPEANNEVLVV